MELTAQVVKEAYDGLEGLRGVDLPAPTGFKVRTMRRALYGPVEDIEAEMLRILQAYVDVDPAGGFRRRPVGHGRVVYVARTPQDQLAFEREWTALLASKVDVDLPLLSPADFAPPPGQAPPMVAPRVFELLGPLLLDADPAPAPAPV